MPSPRSVRGAPLRLLENGLSRTSIALAAALLVFAILLLILGRNPLAAYAAIFSSTLGSSYGFSEVLVKLIPLILLAVAVAVPARVGLVNVGGEGQMYMGAWLASWAGLTFADLPRPLLLGLMLVLSCLGGGAWAALPAVLRARGWLNETISTLLLNYVAILFVQFLVFGPWRDPLSANFPQSGAFELAAQLPTFGATRVHLGIVFGLVALGAFFAVLRWTRWGFEMRAIGGNAEASRRSGIPVPRYLIATLTIGGAMAGIAGFGEVSAIQGRLRPSLSPGYGYIGFLLSWLAEHSPLGIGPMALLMAVLTAGGDALQIGQQLPFASVNLLMALTLFAVLALRKRVRRVE